MIRFLGTSKLYTQAYDYSWQMASQCKLPPHARAWMSALTHTHSYTD